VRETGKPFADARGGVEAGIGSLLQYAEVGPLHRGKSLQGAFHAIDYTVSQPRGVVLALTPWNDPVAIACGLLGAALVTGNTVVHKPSERTPHIGQLLGELIAAHLPPDVLVTVPGDGETGRALAGRQGVDVIAHVGSTSAGRSIRAAAAATGAHVVLENGGNDALVVDAGVDPVWAAEQAALGAYANCGQICTSVERIYVDGSVADEFTRHLVEAADRLNRSGGLGPMVDRRLRDEVHSQVLGALDGGAWCLLSGDGADGRARRHARHDGGDVRPGGPGPGRPRLRGWSATSGSI
jgi:betaine-aldehyde dehydrogenase